MSLKHDLLTELEANRNTDLSGQMLADKMGVSRNAVWKAVNALKKDGYEIMSGTNKGYRLAAGSNLLSAEGIGSYLTGNVKSLPVFAFREIDSTNNEAKRMLANGYSGNFLVVSESQTQGRGRNGREFFSPSHTGIYMTLALQTNANFNETVMITTMAAVAVVRAIESLTGKKPQIKWVNDVFLDGRKICGILTEAVMDFETGTAQNAIVGIGLNVSTAEFPEKISESAASLFPDGITRNQLAAEITSQLLELANNLSDKSYLSEYRSHAMYLGNKITYTSRGSTHYATAIGIDDNGGLIIRKTDGSTETLSSGEISVRPI